MERATVTLDSDTLELLLHNIFKELSKSKIGVYAILRMIVIVYLNNCHSWESSIIYEKQDKRIEKAMNTLFNNLFEKI